MKLGHGAHVAFTLLWTILLMGTPGTKGAHIHLQDRSGPDDTTPSVTTTVSVPSVAVLAASATVTNNQGKLSRHLARYPLLTFNSFVSDLHPSP